MNMDPNSVAALSPGRSICPFAATACGRSGPLSCLSIGAALLVTIAALGPASAQGGGQRAITGTATAYELSPPVALLPPAPEVETPVSVPPRVNPLAGEPDGGQRGTWNRGPQPLDPLVPRSRNPAGRTPSLDLRFNGTGNPTACSGCSPPDTIGDVGPNHYVQMVNRTKVTLFDKAGNKLTAPFDLGSLWSSGQCAADTGDPIVLYDQSANRWLLAQFATPRHLCFAISKTANPLGAYHLYTFNVGSFPDYFKVGVWPKGYFVSANEATYTAYAFDRQKMLNGNPDASFVKFTGETNFLLPADVDGPLNPSGGGLFYTFKDNAFHGGDDRIELFRLNPDFVTPANSTFSLIRTFKVAPFTYTVCGFFNFDCIRQKDTNTRLDPVSEWPMHRFAYRKLANREVLVGNFTVGGGSGEQGAAIRWFELRKTTGNWQLFQEGTHDPGDGHDRSIGSIAMDRKGNIALGYSVSSSEIFPSVRYVTRLPGDPKGTMGPEKTLRPGRGSQTGTNRWGDYSAMTVDPTTGCQFWYTNEYYRATSSTNWSTVIGAFTVPTCP
jgi:hypothetical protein